MLELSQLDRLDKVLAGCQPRGENWGSSHFGYWSEVVEMGCHRLDPLVELLGNVGCVRVCLHEFEVLIDVLLSLVAAGEMPSVVMVPPLVSMDGDVMARPWHLMETDVVLDVLMGRVLWVIDVMFQVELGIVGMD